MNGNAIGPKPLLSSRAPATADTTPATTTTVTTPTTTPTQTQTTTAIATRADVDDAAIQKVTGRGNVATDVLHALGAVAKLAVEHPLGAIGIAGAATFIVGAFGLVSPFVGIMGGVVSVSSMIHSGASRGGDL
jgi:hypothetical protein